MAAKSKPRVLIVDDEEDLVRPVAYRLGIAGFDVMMEPNGRLGYERAMSDRPDLILLDVMMPGLDGLSLCRILKDQADTAAIPVIMVTAKTTMGDVEEAFDALADDFVGKPFEWTELFGKINRALVFAGIFET